MRISDSIENFIKQLLMDSEQVIQLQRNELAEYFGCSPSQINYVLATRFTPHHGYVIKSKRGGGGCIEIIKMENDGSYFNQIIQDKVGDTISEIEARQIIAALRSRNVISSKEARIIYASLNKQALSLPLDDKLKSEIRAKILKNILLELSINLYEENL